MIRFLRNAAILIVGIAAVVIGALHLQQSPRGKVTPDEPRAERGEAEQDKHAEEGAVELSDAKVAAAGIELVTAGPGVVQDTLFLNGILQPNQETLIQVTPRFPGVVREVRKRIGDRVEKGELLGKVESNQSLTVYELRAPLAGTVIDRQIALGEYASEQKPAFTIADLSTVWADFSIYRQDLNRIRPGATVMVDLEDGQPPVESTISYISPVGNSETQSSLARAVLRNDDRRLRPGLFVTGRVLMKEKPAAVVVKSSALQTIENRTVVFVRNGDKFEPRDIEIGQRDPEHVEISFGLMEGDVYAAKNSFVIKAELAKGTASHEH